MRNYYTDWRINIGEESVEKIDKIFRNKLKYGSCEIKEIAEAFGIDSGDAIGEVISAYQNPLSRSVYIIQERAPYPQTFFWNEFTKKVCADKENKNLAFTLEADDNSFCLTNSPLFKDLYRIRGWRKHEELYRFFPHDYYNDISENRLKKMLDELFDESNDLNMQIKMLTDKYESVAVCRWQVDQICELTPYQLG